MSVTLAFGHVIGAVIATLAFANYLLKFEAWELRQNKKSASEEISIALCIPVERLDEPENSSKIVQYEAARFSSDRFQNRLSDLCLWIQFVWGWLGFLIGVGILVFVIWDSFTVSHSNAIYAWWMLITIIFFGVISNLITFTCKFITGRFPGQAGQARKNLAQFVNSQQSTGQ